MTIQPRAGKFPALGLFQSKQVPGPVCCFIVFLLVRPSSLEYTSATEMTEWQNNESCW